MCHAVQKTIQPAKQEGITMHNISIFPLVIVRSTLLIDRDISLIKCVSMPEVVLEVKGHSVWAVWVVRVGE